MCTEKKNRKMTIIDGVPCSAFYKNYCDFCLFPLEKKINGMINCVPGGRRLMTLDGDAA